MKELMFETFIISTLIHMLCISVLYAGGIDFYQSDLPYIIISIVGTTVLTVIIRVIIQILKEEKK